MINKLRDRQKQASYIVPTAPSLECVQGIYTYIDIYINKSSCDLDWSLLDGLRLLLALRSVIGQLQLGLELLLDVGVVGTQLLAHCFVPSGQLISILEGIVANALCKYCQYRYYYYQNGICSKMFLLGWSISQIALRSAYEMFSPSINLREFRNSSSKSLSVCSSCLPAEFTCIKYIRMLFFNINYNWRCSRNLNVTERRGVEGPIKYIHVFLIRTTSWVHLTMCLSQIKTSFRTVIKLKICVYFQHINWCLEYLRSV